MLFAAPSGPQSGAPSRPAQVLDVSPAPVCCCPGDESRLSVCVCPTLKLCFPADLMCVTPGHWNKALGSGGAAPGRAARVLVGKGLPLQLTSGAP